MAAIYARFSSDFQHSIEDQVRECVNWAAENGYDVPPEYVFTDAGKSGRLRRRPGRMALEQAVVTRKFDALIVFSTSRLERNDYRIKQFLVEELVERNIRAVFVMSGIDTECDGWETLLTVNSIVDAAQGRFSRAHIQAAQGGLFLKGRVHGTITFGYMGVPLPEGQTRRGRPACRLAIDPRTGPWVQQIFAWYVHDRLTRRQIVQRLNQQNAPLPPRCTGGRWTDLAVKLLLRNPRCRGLWEYGATEAKLVNSKDYIRQIRRAKALQRAVYKDLQIVDDETWYMAQELMVGNPHNAGRKPVDGQRRSRPKLLNRLLFCGYHDRPLVVGGGDGRSYLCPICQEDGRKQLYNMLNRRLALRIVCGTIMELIRADGALVSRVVDACRAAQESAERPDAGQLGQLRQRHERLGRHIQQVLGTFAETEEDTRENQAKAEQLRRERGGVQAELAKLESAASRPVRIPTETEVRERVGELADALVRAAKGDDDQAFGDARRILEEVTGGRIIVYQAGPRERKRGWLRGEFRADVVKMAATEFGVVAGDSPVAIQCNFREPPIHERTSDDVKSLFDQGLKYREIAEKVGSNRNIVAKALAFWHRSHGLSAQDGRKCVGRLRRSAPLAERIAERVMDLVREDMPLQEIGKKLRVGRNTVTRAIRFWHEQRGLPVPDGRALRKQRNARLRNG